MTQRARLFLALLLSIPAGCDTLITAVGEGGSGGSGGTGGNGGGSAVGGAFTTAISATVGGAGGQCSTPAPVGELTLGPGTAVAVTGVGGFGGSGFDCISGVQDEAGHIWTSNCNDATGCACVYDNVEICTCVATDSCTTTCCPYPWNAPV